MRHLISAPLLLLFITTGCRDDEEISTQEKTYNLNGYVQKGPFINGTAITVSELDKRLVATGKNFTTQIVDNKGAFSLRDVKLQSDFVQLIAEGFYFDEVRGEKSAAQLTLFALADVSNASSVNVNLLSHLEKDRVTYLMQEEEKSFSVAKQQAQREILSIFGIEKANMIASELLDISQDGEDNAILLAISAIVQGNNSVAELSELLADIITDIREDGVLDSESTQEKIRGNAMALKLNDIRQHLEVRYEELGVDATIPNFEQYVDSDGDGFLNKDEDDTPDDFAFESQVDVAINDTLISNAITISGLKEGSTARALVADGWLVMNGSVTPISVSDTDHRDTLSAAEVKNGDQLQIQLISSRQYAEPEKASLTIGTLVRNFRAVTDDYLSDKFSFSSQENVALETYYTSDTITISGLPHATSVKVDQAALIKNGGEVIDGSFVVINGDRVALRLLSSDTYGTTTTATLTINKRSSSFSITTDDYTPDTFSFKSKDVMDTSTVYYSDTVKIVGLPHSTPAGVAQFSTSGNGAIFVNGTRYTTNTFELREGDNVWMEVVSPKDYFSLVSSTLTINELNVSFDVKTKTAFWQKKADFPGSAHTGFVVSDKLYIIGDKGFYQYISETDEWIERAPFEGSNAWYSSGFSLKGKGYICFGDRYNHNRYSHELHNELWMYDPLTNKWKERASFPANTRMFQTAFTTGDKAYVGLGEIMDVLHDYGYPSKDIWQYDPVANAWEQKSDFPGGDRLQAVGISLLDNPIVTSGWDRSLNLGTDGANLFVDIWQYKAESDTWTEKKRANFIPHGGFELGNELFLYCEEYEAYGISGVLKYNYEEDTWETVDDLFFEGIRKKLFFSVYNKGYLYIPETGFFEFTPPQD